MLNGEEDSRQVARSAIMLAMTSSREEENIYKQQLLGQNVQSAAVDYGGQFVPSIMRIVERAMQCATRAGIISDTHHEQGALAGACREALSQVSGKALGLSVGGKIAIARKDEHIAVAVFFSIGLMHFNEVCIGMGHRAI